MTKQPFSFITVLIAAALFVVAIGCQSVPSERLSAAALEAHIDYLADDALEGREAGTSGSEKAERYIAEALAAAGLTVEEQVLQFVAGAKLGAQNAVKIDGKELTSEAFRPLAYSNSASGSWQAVFAGYGIEAPDLGHDDYANVDVAGKLVIVVSGSPDGDNPHGSFGEHSSARAKALTAVHKNAVAILVVVRQGDSLPEFRGSNVSRDVGIPVVAITAEAARERLQLDVDEKLLEALDAHRPVSRSLAVSVDLNVDVQLERRTTRNILGWLEATNPEAVDEVIIIGAHHDHLGRGGVGSMSRDRIGEIHNGADDNASGVAGVIELARYLQRRAQSLRRHVLFMTFAAEEWGLLGSKYFKDHPILRLPACDGRPERPLRAVAMLNMDMIGRFKENRLLAFGVATSSEWPSLLESIRSESHPDLVISVDNQKELMGSSDHISFYQLGMPVVFFFTNTHRQYHTPDDDLYRTNADGHVERMINVDGMTRVLHYIADVSIALANRDHPVPYEDGVDLMPRVSFKVVLRLLPDYGADVEGMGVASVTPGGPAEKAGLKSGDVIVRFGKTSVRSVRDYMVGLGKAKPGEPVEVEFDRGGDRKVVEVRPQGMGSH